MVRTTHFTGNVIQKKLGKKMRERHWDNSGKNNYFFGRHHTEETKKKISEARKGMVGWSRGLHIISEERKKKISEEHSIPVYQFDRNMNFIKEFQSAIAAERELGIASTHIADSCKIIGRSAGGFIWVYKSKADSIDKKEYIEAQIPRPMKQYFRPVLQFSKQTGALMNEYKNFFLAEIYTGVPKNKIMENCKGVYKSAHGYVWKLKKVGDCS